MRNLWEELSDLADFDKVSIKLWNKNSHVRQIKLAFSPLCRLLFALIPSLVILYDSMRRNFCMNKNEEREKKENEKMKSLESVVYLTFSQLLSTFSRSITERKKWRHFEPILWTSNLPIYILLMWIYSLNKLNF